NLGDGVQAAAQLIGADLSKTDEKLLLEMEFVLKHPELTREEARHKFNRDFNRKFTIDKEEFDSDADYEDALKDLNIDKKMAVEQARKYLSAKQEEIKTKPSADEKKKNEVPEAVQQGIVRNIAEFDKFVNGDPKKGIEPAKEIVWSVTDKDDLVFKLTPKQLDIVKRSVHSWAKNPASYNEKGELLTGDSAEDMFIRTAMSLFFKDILAVWGPEVTNIASKLKAEEIANKKPTGKATAKGEMADLDIYKQAEILAKRRKANQ